MKIYAVVRVRGSAKVPGEVEDTMNMLNLTRVNHCVVVPANPSYEGMLRKAKDYVTWGEVEKDVLEMLVAKRGKIKEEKDLKPVVDAMVNGKTRESGAKKVFRLSPPSGGYKSVKSPFPKGDLGYRGEKINSLLRRMI